MPLPTAVRRALVALLAVAALLVTSTPAGAAGPADDGAVPGPVVLLGTTGLRWDDVSPEGTPALWSLLQEASVADLAIRSVRTVACPIDGWLALSAGRRAADERRPSSEPLCRTPKEPARQGTTAVLQDFSVYQRIASEGTFDARPGTLGDLVRTSRVSVTAVGPGAAIALAGTDGKVVGDYEARPRDADRLADLLVPRLERDDLLVVDLGTVRDGDDLGPKDPDRLAGSRVDQVARLDARVAAALSVLPDDATVLLASLADSGLTPHLQALAATGPAPGGTYGESLLGSGSTRQDGLVQSTDLLPTLLTLLGIEVPTGLPGAVVTPVGGGGAAEDRRRRVLDLNEAAITVQPLVVWFFNGLVIAQILLYGAAALALRNNWGGQDGRVRVLGVLRRVAVVFASVPVSTFLANLVPWWRAEHDLLAVVAAVFAWVVVIAGAALLGPWRDRRLGPLGIVCGLTAGVLAADVLTGSHLQVSSLMGQQPVVAGRFYGLGNVQFALFATGALMLATSLADAALRVGRRRLGVAVVVVVGLVAVVIDGTPGIGSDFGGPPAMVPAFALLALLVAGVRITWRRVALIGVGTVAVVAGLCVADWLRPPDERTHLGRFLQTVIDGGALAVIQRKALQNWEILTGSYLTLLVPFGAVFVGSVLMRPSSFGAPALQRTYEASPTLRHGLTALLVMLTIGFAVNDSGTVVPAIGATLVIPLLIAASVRTIELSPGGAAAA